MKRTIIFAWLFFSINLMGMQRMQMGGRQEGRPQSLYGTLVPPSRPGTVSPIEIAKLTERPEEQKPTGAVQVVTLLRGRPTKDATIKELEKLRKLDLDIGIGALKTAQLASKEDPEYWLALAFLQRAASAYARLEAFKNEFSDQEKKAFEDIANFGYWFENTEKFTQASFWQALANAIFYIKHPRNQEWKSFLTANNIKLLEDLSNKLSGIKTTFDNQLDRNKVFATVLASAAASNLYLSIEQFLQALLILRIGNKSSEQDLIKASTIFETLLTEIAKNKSLEAELEKAKITLREIANFRNNLDQKTIVQDLQRNKEQIDRMLAKETVKGTRKLEERRTQPGIIPVPMPVPIREKREQEQAVAGIERPQPQPTQPIIEQTVSPTIEPVVTAQPQPESTIVAPAPVTLGEPSAPVPPVSVRPEELPAPSLEIAPVEGMEEQTKTLSGPELADKWRTYNREMRTKKTAAQMKELVERLENEKQLVAVQPGILERAKDQLAQLQEEEKEQQRLQGMQLIPYTSRPDIAKPEEPKTPRYTVVPGAEHLLEGKTEEQRLPAWQQEMIEEQQRQFAEQLNEKLRQQLLEELQQEQVQQPPQTAPVTVIPVTTPVAPLAQPIARPTAMPTPSVPKPARPVTPPVQPPAPAPVAEQPKPIFPRAEQVAQIFAPRPTTPAPVSVAPEPELQEIPPVRPPVPQPSPFVAAPEPSRLSGPVSVAAQTGVITPTPVAPIQPAVQVQPARPPVASTVSVTSSITPIGEKKPTVSRAPENIIAVIEKELQRFKDMHLPAIIKSSKDKDTIALAKVFLSQALDAFELYNKYQPEMRRQEVLIELRDWVIFFNQLEQAYQRALPSGDSQLAAGYFQAVQVAIEGEEKGALMGFMKGRSIATKEQEQLLKELKTRFASNIEEAQRFARIFEEATKLGLIKPVWEFVTGMAVAIREPTEVTDKERQKVIEVLTALQPLVDKNSNLYNEEVEKQLHSAREKLAHKSINKNKYIAFIDTRRPVYDDITNTLTILKERISGGKPLTLAEQSIQDIRHALRAHDPSVVTKLQEAVQLPPEERKEVIQTFQKLTPEKQQELTQIITQEVEKEVALGNVQDATQLVQQVQKVLPAQQQAIEVKVQPIIASAQRKQADIIAAQTAQVIPALEKVQGPTLVQPTVMQPPAPITPEEKEFLKQKLVLSDQNMYRVIDIFTRATKLNDEESIRLAAFAMRNLMDKLNKLKAAALAQLNTMLVEQLRSLWQDQVQAMVVSYLASAEQAIALTQRFKRLKELEMLMDEAPTTQELHNMIPELLMMIDLGQKNESAQAISKRAQDLYERVERRLKAFTRWIDPANR